MPRVMEIVTPLGEDMLLFHGMHAREEMGRLSECQIDLLSPKNDVKPDDMLGKNVTVKLALPDDSTRYFNGYVTRFSAGGQGYGRYYRYFAVVHPWLWFLTRTTDCRIFQEMTVPDIIKKVFGDREDGRLQVRADGHLPEVDLLRAVPRDRLQLRQPADGGGRHLVLLQAHRRPQHRGAHRFHEQAHGDARLRNDSVHLARTGCAAGARAHQQLGFLARDPARRLRARRLRPRAAERRAQDAEGADRARIRRATTRSTTTPATTCRSRTASSTRACASTSSAASSRRRRRSPTPRACASGRCSRSRTCTREDQNREHLILSASYDLEFSEYEAMPEGAGTGYRCSFVAMSSEQQFRPKRSTPKPFVQGPQTAMVVGPAGDEIYTDKFGRVKVQFHWDRYGKKDENSSCWIRVSQPWAGKGWGSVSTPRIGQEVIVDFLEGDPDQPIITGRVYNAESQPPFGFPAGAVLSGIKSQTHKGGGLQRAVDGRHGREGEDHHPRPVQHEHHRSSTIRRRRSTTTGPTRSTSTTRRRWAATRRSTSSRTRRSTSM